MPPAANGLPKGEPVAPARNSSLAGADDGSLHVREPTRSSPTRQQDPPDWAGGFNQPGSQMETRVANVLKARANRFAAADANIQKRIDRLRSVATSLASEGASATLITKVNGTLDSAQTHLDNAMTNEKDVVGPAFKAIPSATNKKAAFFEARAAGRDSVAELKLARQDLRAAVHQLRAIVKAMKATEDDEASGS